MFLFLISKSIWWWSNLDSEKPQSRWEQSTNWTFPLLRMYCSSRLDWKKSGTRSKLKYSLRLGVGTLIYFRHIFFFRTQLTLRYHLFCVHYLHNHDFYRTHMNQNLAIEKNNKTERAFNFIGCAINDKFFRIFGPLSSPT